MLTYEQMEEYTGEVIKEAKKRSGLHEVGIIMRRIYGEEFGTMWQPTRPNMNYYPRVDKEGILVFVGKEPTDAYTDYKNRLVYVGLKQTLLTEKEFKKFVASQIKKSVAERFRGVTALEKLVEGLDLYISDSLESH